MLPFETPGLHHDSQRFYAEDALWYAACLSDVILAQRKELSELLPTNLSEQCVVDIGAGVGSMLSVFADLRAKSIFAIEPSHSMSVGLTTHVALAPRLADTTTVLPLTFREALPHLPNQWDVVTLLNVHGHLPLDAEQQIWRTAAERLAPGGRLVFGTQPPYTAAAVDETVFGQQKIGRHTWTMTGHASPSDAQHVTWSITRQITDAHGKTVCQAGPTLCRWRVSSVNDVHSSAESVGLKFVAASQKQGPHRLCYDQPTSHMPSCSPESSPLLLLFVKPAE